MSHLNDFKICSLYIIKFRNKLFKLLKGIYVCYVYACYIYIYILSSYLLVRRVDGVLSHGRVLHGLADAVHSFGNVALLSLELRILDVLDARTVHAVVRHLLLLLLRHFTLDSHHNQHFVADTLVVVRESRGDGHLRIGLFLRGVDFQGIRFGNRVALLSVYADLEVRRDHMIYDR